MSLNFPDDLPGLQGVPAEANELFSSMAMRTRWCTTTILHGCISVRTNLACSQLLMPCRNHVERSEDEQEENLGIEVLESKTKELGKHAIMKSPNIPENG